MTYAILSAILPGLGQFVQGKQARGLAILLAFATAMIFTVWWGRAGVVCVPGHHLGVEHCGCHQTAQREPAVFGVAGDGAGDWRGGHRI